MFIKARPGGGARPRDPELDKSASRWIAVTAMVRNRDGARAERVAKDQAARDADACRRCKRPPIVARQHAHPEARDPWRAVYWCTWCVALAFGSRSDAVAASEVAALPLADVGARPTP